MSYFSGEKMTGGYGGPDIINSCTISVDKGEIVTILGPNGAGKSTVMLALLGMLNLSQGTITINEKDISNLSPQDRVKEGISFVPQTKNVFTTLTVEENLMAILEYTEPDKSIRKNFVEILLNDFSLTNRRNFNVMKLSGGQRRRVEIARALCAKPNFILLDEPFTGIDPMQLNEIKNLIKNLKTREIGVLITDLNVREALGIIDRAYIIHDGNVLMHGKPNEIINSELVKKFYLGKSFKF